MASRSPSPISCTEKVRTISTTDGKISTHGEVCTTDWPALSSVPSEVSGALMPRPRKLSEVSLLTAPITPSTVLMTSTEPRFGTR